MRVEGAEEELQVEEVQGQAQAPDLEVEVEMKPHPDHSAATTPALLLAVSWLLVVYRQLAAPAPLREQHVAAQSACLLVARPPRF